jgi:hypothetical protein
MEHEPAFENLELLQQLIDPRVLPEHLWGEHDLAELLELQLSAPVATDIEHLGPPEALAARELCARASPTIRTYADLLAHPSPPIELLRLVKTFAQSLLHAPERALPHQIVLLIYDTAIIAARLRHGQPLSDLPDHKLLESARWLRSQRWLDARTSELLRLGMDRIAGDIEGRRGAEAGS